MTNDKELDDIIDGLKTEKSLDILNSAVSASPPDVTDDTLNQFIIDKMTTLVKNGMDTIESLQQTVITGFEPEEMTAFSSLIQSVIKAADTLNKINIESKKAKTAKEIKAMDIATKKQLGGHSTSTTNVLVATREDVIKQFLTNAKKEAEKVIKTIPEEDYTKLEEPK